MEFMALRPHKILCIECARWGNQSTMDAIKSGRCDDCQDDREEHYAERMKQEHPPERVRSHRDEHSTEE